jgi:hypothetical protein
MLPLSAYLGPIGEAPHSSQQLILSRSFYPLRRRIADGLPIRPPIGQPLADDAAHGARRARCIINAASNAVAEVYNRLR